MATAAPHQMPEFATDLPTVPAWRVGGVAALALVLGYTAVWGFEQWRFEVFPGYLQASSQLVVAGREAIVETLMVDAGAEVAVGKPVAQLNDLGLERRLREQRLEVETRERDLTRLEAVRDSRIEKEVLELEDRIFDTRMRAAEFRRRAESLTAPPLANHRWPTLAHPREETPWWNPEPAPWRMDFSDRSQIRQMFNEVPAPIEPDLGRNPGPRPLADSAADQWCEQRIAELEQRLQELPEKIGKAMRIDAEQARLDFARQELALLEVEQGKLTVRAPTAGRLGLFLKQPGERVAAQEPLVQLFDEERPFLLVQIPSERVADFAPGTELELVFPGRKVGWGRVREIPPQTSATTGSNGALGTTLVDVHVTPVGALWPELPFGSQVVVRRPR
ncbi:MAG: HlyD family secretion protein [Planctomycetaceae bacterium]|jgi:multidrug resistance efflux pump